jgi:hypothetical protein
VIRNAARTSSSAARHLPRREGGSGGQRRSSRRHQHGPGAGRCAATRAGRLSGREVDESQRRLQRRVVPVGELTHLEVGVENAWLSSIPERIWSRDHGEAPDIEGFAQRRPDLAWCTKPIAIEAAADAPRPCWAAVAISSPQRTGHALNTAKLRAVVGQLQPYLSG